MASGMGVRGTTGRCYGFFADMKHCQHEVRQTKVANEECDKSREDYFECLHGRKEQARISEVVQEHQRQNRGGSIAKMIREKKEESSADE